MQKLKRPHRIFLLSPAYTGGERARLVLNERSRSDLSVRLRREGVPLGEAYAFVSGLCFRGKLAYASAFAFPPEGIPGSYIITPGRGLVTPETVVTLQELQGISAAPVDASDPRYALPLARDARQLVEKAGPDCDLILLGSVATAKYVGPLIAIAGQRLRIPLDFIGKGDMSRGGLLLRCAQFGVELSYVPVVGALRYSKRPPKLA
jgi:hypothetical protein